MIGISEIASYVPAGGESNLDKAGRFGVTKEFITDKIGVRRVSRRARGEETSDLCVRAYEALARKPAGIPADVGCLMVCTQNPDGRGLPHVSAIVHGKLGLPDRCAALDISLGCSGYVYGLSVCSAFMKAQGFKRGLLFTADPYSKIVDPDDKNTALLFGDAATVTVLQAEPGAGSWVPMAYRFATRGSEGACLINLDGTLTMNGRAVFNFSAVEVPIQVRQVLESAGVRQDDVDLFLFHQGSKYILDTLGKRLGLPGSKVPSNLADQGNTVSSSIPLLFEAHKDRREPRLVLMSGFGVGLSWATGLLKRI